MICLSQKEKLDAGLLKQISDQTKIPENTLKTWRKKLKEDSSWRPNHGSPGKPRLFTVEQEKDIHNEIVNEKIEASKYFNGEHLQAITLKKYKEFHFSQNRDELEKDENKGCKEIPKFSYKWRKSYESRNGFSERVPYLKRRSDSHDEKIANFIQDFEVGRMQYEDSGIVNGDETSMVFLKQFVIKV